MDPTRSRVLLWALRGLGLAFTAFLSVFALDALDAGYGVAETALVFLVHLAPAALVAGALAVAWRRERVGAVLFVAIALAYVWMSQGRWWWIVPAPLLAIGTLFLLSGALRRRAS